MRGTMSAWATAAAVVMLATPAMAASVKDGVDAWQGGDYAKAVSIWRPLADGGNSDAAFDLAQAYKLGRGVPTDLAKAKEYYGRAAKAGHAQAAANYGLLLFQDGDRAGAMPWIKKASDDGDPRAQYVYGTALFNGDLAPQDWPRAYALMTRAASAGLPQATTSLSQMDQFLSAADRQKGLTLATQMASQPVPPTNRTLVTVPVGSTIAARPEQVAKSDLAPPPSYTPPARVRNEEKPKESKPTRPAPAVTAVQPERAPVRASAGGAWQVQLGAYGSAAGARSAWTTLTAKAAALKALRPSYVQAGAVYRLRATGLADKAAAERACAAAKGAGAGCFPVAP